MSKRGERSIGKADAAMVPGLVLLKVKQISRKKEQIHGFYIQIKNILKTFLKEFSTFDLHFL